jgi:hypothetical protein
MLLYLLKGSLPWQSASSRDELFAMKARTTVDAMCVGVPGAFHDRFVYRCDVPTSAAD